MTKISSAKRVRNMIDGLEELKSQHNDPPYVSLRADIQQAIRALERVWKQLVG